MTGNAATLYAPDQEFGCIPPEVARSLSGIEMYEMMLAGKLSPPPIYRQANVKLVDAADGRTRFHAMPTFNHYNPIGTVHGGWIATLLDTALASCIHTKLPKGSGFATIEFKTNIVRPVTERTGRLVCDGKVIHFGRTFATSEARITTSEGKLVAHGLETCSVFPVGQEQK